MAKRHMPKVTSISDQERSSVQSEAVERVNKVEEIPTQVRQVVTATVINCKKLNLRTKPSKAAPVIYEMPADSKLAVDLDRSINGWLHVCTESGLSGYCMKQFVSIN